MASITVADFINRVAFKLDKSSVDKVNGTIRDIKSTATKMLGTIGIGLSLTAANVLVEEFGRINDQIKNSTAALGDQADIQKKIMEAASKTRSSYAATAEIVSNLVHESPELFGNIDEAVKFNNAATMLFKSAGKTNEEIVGLMEAINKSFAKGYVDSETMSKLLETSPEAVELLNRKLGTTSDKLEELASSRAMTIADLKAAFVDNADAIENKFGGVQYRITDALTVIRNKWGLWLSQMDTTIGITNKIAHSMVKVSDTVMNGMNKARNAVSWLCDKLGGADKLFRLISITVGTVFGVRSLATLHKFITGLKELDVAALKIKLKVVGIMAAIVLLALLIEDFISFMRGNDSLIGSLLEKAGVDANKFRDNVIKIWQNIKAILLSIWLGLKNVAIPIFQGIWKTIKDAFEKIGQVIEKIVPKFSEFIDSIANGNVDLEGWEKFGKTLAKIAVFVLKAVVAVKAFAVVIKAIIAIKKVWAAVQGVVNAVMAASPITWIISAIIALIAIIILLVTHWDKVKSAIQAVWEKIVDVFSNIASWIRANVIDPIVDLFTGLWTSVTATVGNIKDAIIDGLLEAVDWIKSLPAKAVQWGADIIQGIVDGIKGAVGKVGEAVAGVADKIKSFIGFSEPEAGPLSDFHTYMPDMLDMMTKGINANKGKITSAMLSLCGDMSTIARAGAAVTPATYAAAIGSGNISKTVIQTNNFNQQFSGERAMQQRAAKAMEKSTNDVTSQLARALAYLR